MNIKSLILENKSLSSLILIFVLGSGILGYLAWDSWNNYATATSEYNTKAAELDRLAHKDIFPSESNLKKLTQTLSQDQESLGKLQKALTAYQVTSFGDFLKTKPQDQPQYLQDALRDQVTAIKSAATDSGTTLPQSFYLGLDEYENHLPQPDQLTLISKQLNVLKWLGKTIADLKGATVADFSVTSPSTSKPSSPGLPPPPATISNSTFESLGTTRIALRCDQTEFRNLINSISTAPYFLIIDDIKVQNSSGEPPLKTAPAAVDQPAADGSSGVQRLPIIVGRESLNVSLSVKMIDFPTATNSQSPSK